MNKWIKGKDQYYITNGKYTICKAMVKGKWKYALFDGDVSLKFSDDVEKLKGIVNDRLASASIEPDLFSGDST